MLGTETLWVLTRPAQLPPLAMDPEKTLYLVHSDSSFGKYGTHTSTKMPFSRNFPKSLMVSMLILLVTAF